MTKGERIYLTCLMENRELSALGPEAVEEAVKKRFISLIAERLLQTVELREEQVLLVPEVDYSLAPYQFSNQFGVEYSVDLTILTPEQLEAYTDKIADELMFDQAAQQALWRDDLCQC